MTEKTEGTKKRPGSVNWTANEEGEVEDLVLLDEAEVTPENVTKVKEKDG